MDNAACFPAANFFTVFAHPDVEWFLPTSPGTWVATDDRDGVNLGTISGSYGLRDGFVGTTCDFDGDADCDVRDLNDMLSVGPVAPGIPSIGNEPFDLTGDGLIDNSDVDQWLTDAALINGFASLYKRGDATLNGIVDGRDFGFWNSNKFTSSDAAFAVPEPGAVAVCLLVSILVLCERRSPDV